MESATAPAEIILEAKTEAHESWYQRIPWKMIFMVTLALVVAGVVYLLFSALWKWLGGDCVCTTTDGKPDCKTCKAKDGAPKDTDCTLKIIECNTAAGAKGVTDAFAGLVEGCKSLGPWLCAIFSGLAFLGIFLVWGIATRLKRAVSGETEGPGVIDTFRGIYNGQRSLEKRIKKVNEDYKEFEEYLDGQIKLAESTGDTAKADKFKGAKSDLEASKATVLELMRQVEKGEIGRNLKSGAAKKTQFTEYLDQSVASLEKAKKAVKEGAQGEEKTGKASDEAAKEAQQNAEVGKDEFKRAIEAYE